MKKIVLSAAAIVFCGSLMAQDSRASVGLEVAMPMGDWADFYGIGLGGTLGYEIPVGDNLGVMAQLGYISFSGKDFESSTTVNGVTTTTTVETDAAGMIPIQIGAKYYFSENQEGAYLGALTGVHMQSVEEVTSINLTTGAIETEKKLKSNFGIAPVLGFMVTENIDLGLRYQMIFAKDALDETVTNSYLGLRAAYMF